MATRKVTKSGRGVQALTRQVVTQKVTDLGFSEAQLKQVPARVRNMTVGDLEDFARLMSGKRVENKTVNSLTVTDVKGIEDLFGGYKSMAVDSLSAVGIRTTLGRDLDLAISVSCCSCTPCCCCCGAADVNPFQ